MTQRETGRSARDVSSGASWTRPAWPGTQQTWWWCAAHRPRESKGLPHQNVAPALAPVRWSSHLPVSHLPPPRRDPPKAWVPSTRTPRTGAYRPGPLWAFPGACYTHTSSVCDGAPRNACEVTGSTPQGQTPPPLVSPPHPLICPGGSDLGVATVGSGAAHEFTVYKWSREVPSLKP